MRVTHSPDSRKETEARERSPVALAALRAGARDRFRPEWMAAIEEHLKGKAPLVERGDASVQLHETLREALATLLWRQGGAP